MCRELLLGFQGILVLAVGVSKRTMHHAAAVFCILVLATSTAGARGIELTKTEDVDSREIVYAARGANCQIFWISRRFGDGSSFGLTERSKCHLKLADQNRYRAALLTRLSADTNRLEGLRNFYWGRLQRGDSNDEYAVRLTRATSKSSNWDSSTGTLLQYPSGLNSFVLSMLTEGNIFPELSGLFSQFGFSIKANGVEKVIISSSEPMTRRKLSGKFPVDCLLTFEIRTQ
jgi:hypothetical protein